MTLPVSVVIPTHNRPDMLRGAIESVLAQTYPVREIIVVDNGRPEETERVVKEFSIPIVLVRSSVPGPSTSRNRGVEISRGDYIAFLDDDDLWHPDKLAVQMDFLEKHPDVVMVSSRIFPFGREIAIDSSAWISGDLFARLFMESFVATPTVVVKKDALVRVGGFDPRYMRAEDYDLWLRITDRFITAHLKSPTAWFRSSPGQLSKNKIDLRKSAMAVLRERYNPKKVSSRRFNRRMSDVLIFLGREQVKSGDAVGGRRSLIEAFRLTPFRLRPIRYLIGNLLRRR